MRQVKSTGKEENKGKTEEKKSKKKRKR